jgi:hypothetical protein
LDGVMLVRRELLAVEPAAAFDAEQLVFLVFLTLVCFVPFVG